MNCIFWYLLFLLNGDFFFVLSLFFLDAEGNTKLAGIQNRDSLDVRCVLVLLIFGNQILHVGFGFCEL
jgi:hypothetical protein